MKKIITISCLGLSFVGLFFILGTQTACQKQNTNCTCVITVDSGTGANATPVSGATVKLYAPHGQNGATGTTNGAGDVTFTFSLPAIYNIDAKYVRGPNDTLSSNSQIIQLQVGQTESATVTIVR